ncbi:MAG: type II toxin-antitoxin system PemK/MazF family toxin [Campylobacterales bacterium]|nr:type II toxin-antitoxin system PemK/MazF family toxin [Campylobacterales bacterium]
MCLVEFGKSRNSFEFGKNRPVILFQTDKLNYAIEDGIYDYCLVIPLSTTNDIVTSDFRLEIKAREKLENNSFAVCNSICFLHKKYFNEKLASLDNYEIELINNIVKNVFDISHIS